eukprot:6204729-Pleurochrysis_carterae.AAC.4
MSPFSTSCSFMRIRFSTRATHRCEASLQHAQHATPMRLSDAHEKRIYSIGRSHTSSNHALIWPALSWCAGAHRTSRLVRLVLTFNASASKTMSPGPSMLPTRDNADAHDPCQRSHDQALA